MSLTQLLHRKAQRGNNESMRQAQKKTDARAGAILGAARALFGRDGFDATAMADIAARAGIAEGTVYNYFPSKQALGMAVASDWFGEIADGVAHDLALLPDFRARLARIVAGHFAAILDAPAFYLMLLREVRAAPGYAKSDARKENRCYTGLLLQVLRDAAALGQVGGALPLSAMRDMVYGGVEHVALSALVRGERLDRAALSAQLAESWARAFSPPVAAPDRLAAIEARLKRIEGKL